MISIGELQNLLSNKEFNPYINIDNPDKVLLHLLEELGEAIHSYRKYEQNLHYELGDIMILLCF
jgi:NTP pyrophosphatase (non-canonical NTP hydrolase)